MAESLPSTSDNWRQVASSSPPPRLVTIGDTQERRMAPTSDSTQNLKF
ncbi:hypothetical protein A2U01_0115310, partial [Trifolium medium]|nr:hypothetical protein [Trifolium medium]